MNNPKTQQAQQEQESHSTNLPHQTTQQLILKATDPFGKKTESVEENKHKTLFQTQKNLHDMLGVYCSY